MSSDFLHDPEFDRPVGKPTRTWKGRIAEILVVLAILVVLFMLLLPAYRSAPRAARRAWCTNNLKQIALALHNYVETHGSLPPAHTVDANGRLLHSWRTLLLPFLEASTLYRAIDLSKPWNDPVNASALARMPDVYRCPATRGATNKTTYLAIVGPEGCFLPDRPRPKSEIVDDPNFTIFMMEADDEHAVPWMAPVDTDSNALMTIGPSTKTHHPGGVNVAFVGGNAYFLPATTPSIIRRKLLTIAGGESINGAEF